MCALWQNLIKINKFSIVPEKNACYINFEFIKRYITTQSINLETTVSVTDIQQQPQQRNEEQKQQQRSLSVAVIGVPNVGKSTFINNLIDHRVCPTSCKVHTTRRTNTAVYTRGNTQLVFYDTPGMVTQREVKKHNLEQTFLSSYRHAVQHADVIAVVHDVSNNWTRGALHATVLDTLKAYPTLPSFLVLNKIDTLKSKRILLNLIRTLTNDTLSHRTHQKLQIKDVQNEVENKPDKAAISWKYFSNVFMVSSITGNGLSDIQEYLINSAKERDWKFKEEVFTEQKPEALIVDSVRARLLDYLPQEIPYRLESKLEYYSEQKGTIYASVQVICPTLRIERLIKGVENGRLRQITERITSDLVETFGKPISLTLVTSHKNVND